MSLAIHQASVFGLNTPGSHSVAVVELGSSCGVQEYYTWGPYEALIIIRTGFSVENFSLVAFIDNQHGVLG